MSDCLLPEAGLLIKLGSALIHAQEYLEPFGHPFDKQTFETLMAQPDVCGVDRGNERVGVTTEKTVAKRAAEMTKRRQGEFHGKEQPD